MIGYNFLYILLYVVCFLALDCSLTLPSSLQGIYYTTNMNGNWIAQAAYITPTANEVVNVSCNNGTWTRLFESSGSSSTNCKDCIMVYQFNEIGAS